jgi:hypothetical protein
MSLTPGAVARTTSDTLSRGDRGAAVQALQERLGIAADGVFGPATAKAVRRVQRRHGLTVDGVVGPATARVLGLDLTALAASTGTLLERIAACESGGDPTAVSADGRYRGKYQFTRKTWRELGGKGDPAAAPERVQDRLAARLLEQRGTAPWPSCA